MRLLGFVLLVVGLLVTVVGTFTGCGSLFSWNGRHAILAEPLPEGRSTHVLPTWGGRRYTVAVQVVFDRDGLESRDGHAVVEAKMPLVVRVKDPMGTTLAEVVGWLDPNEPPNVLYGQAANEATRGPVPELAVERRVGPFGAATTGRLTIDVDLGADRVGSTHILERRVIVHDDAMPARIRNGFIAAGGGAVVFLAGLVVTLIGWFKGRRRSRKGSGI